MKHRRFRVVAGVLAAAAAVGAAGCSPQKMALNRMASALANASSVYESDNDPEFVRLAAPSTLKTIEMLLSQNPNHQQLLLTACSGFTEYSYGFLHVESELKAADAAASLELKSRAAKMYARARNYCLRGLQLRHPGVNETSILQSPEVALRGTTKEDVPWLYWTATSWGAELSVAPNRLLRLQELGGVRALLRRANGLDDSWEHDAIYEAMIAFDGLPALLGGSPAAARADFDKAMQLSDGKSVFARVAFATTLSDPAERTRLLQEAVNVDVSTVRSHRLTNLIAQRYAKALLSAAR